MNVNKALLKTIFVGFFKKIGLDVKRYIPESSNLSYFQELLKKYNIDLVLDVGANIGQFHSELRFLGYAKDVISFEPLSEAYNILKRKESGFSNWIVYERVALGSSDSETIINISNNLVSSSILPIDKKHVDAEPESAYITTEKIVVKKLDSIAVEYNWRSKNIFLKIDTQGFEYEVLMGAKNTMNIVTFIQLELSMEELYTGQKTFYELCDYMQECGFSVFTIFREFLNTTTFETLQYNVIFINNNKRIK